MSGLSLAPVLAGSDLHLVSIRGRAVASSPVLNASVLVGFVLLSLVESSDWFKYSESLSVSGSVLDSAAESLLLGSFSDAGFCWSVFSSSVFCSSSVAKGEPQNRLARDDDLYGADLHRVSSKAFLGGEKDEE